MNIKQYIINKIERAEAGKQFIREQRSRIVLFGEMNETDTHTMNTLTGSAVCLFVLILGISLIIRGMKRKEK